MSRRAAARPRAPRWIFWSPKGTAYCLDCETSVAIAARGAPCPRCGGAKLLVQGGDEMRLKEMEVV